MYTKKLITSPFDASRYIGSVSFVLPDAVRVNLPQAATVSSKQYAGYSILGGQVGEFVFIESEDYAILGRITEVGLPDKERLSIEPVLGEPIKPNPIGFIQLLTTLELSTGKIISGISQHPRIGQQIFSAHPLLVKHIIEQNNLKNGSVIQLATIPQEANTKVNVSPSNLFGRHCTVLGATGGGKSWTVARIAQEIARIGGKAILVDPTGEFHTFQNKTTHVYLGGDKQDDHDNRVYVGFPYWKLTELDLFAIFQPSGASQTPKLREALNSLKLSQAIAGESEAKIYIKKNASHKEYFRALLENKVIVESEGAPYPIKLLPKQIIEECVWESGGSRSSPDHSIWGDYNEQQRGYCETLVAKIYSIIRSKPLSCLFEPERFVSLTEQVQKFLDSDANILRISMEYLSFEHSAKELLTNALGRFLLNKAREGDFLKSPTVVILDEAHQFLNKNIGDENNKSNLDAFGLIAKEGRKYGLTTILATQRPRDIPEDVLSQMGMFVVHRLINERDRQVVEKACGNLDGSAAKFLPTLGQGEAILVGVDFPMPIPVKIIEPEYPPKSEGPQYDKYWK